MKRLLTQTVDAILATVLGTIIAVGGIIIAGIGSVAILVALGAVVGIPVAVAVWCVKMVL
jgi:hypothetical protein